MQKKGNVIWYFIFGMVILIPSTIILIILTTDTLNPDQTEDQICKLAVLTRATSPDELESSIPLKCRTKKYCLSQGEGCEAFIGEKKEDIIEIDLPKNNPKIAANIIQSATANAMVGCWKTLGEGNLDLFGGGRESGYLSNILNIQTLYSAKSTCVICSRVALSKNVLENKEIMREINLNEYMKENNPPETTKNYWETLTNDQIRTFPQELKNDLGTIPEKDQTDELGIIFMQILTEESPWEAGLETGATTGSFVLGTKLGFGSLGGILTLEATGIIAALTGASTGVAAAIQTYNNRQLSAFYCEDKVGGGEEVSGCSIIAPINYHNVGELRNFCGRIEGIP